MIGELLGMAVKEFGPSIAREGVEAVASRSAGKFIGGKIAGAAAGEAGQSFIRKFGGERIGGRVAQFASSDIGQQIISRKAASETRQILNPSKSKPQAVADTTSTPTDPDDLNLQASPSSTRRSVGGGRTAASKGWWQLADQASQDWRQYADRSVARGSGQWDLLGIRQPGTGRLAQGVKGMARDAIGAAGDARRARGSGQAPAFDSGRATAVDQSASAAGGGVSPLYQRHTLYNVREAPDTSPYGAVGGTGMGIGTGRGSSYTGSATGRTAAFGTGAQLALPAAGQSSITTKTTKTGQMGWDF